MYLYRAGVWQYNSWAGSAYLTSNSRGEARSETGDSGPSGLRNDRSMYGIRPRHGMRGISSGNISSALWMWYTRCRVAAGHCSRKPQPEIGPANGPATDINVWMWHTQHAGPFNDLGYYADVCLKIKSRLHHISRCTELSLLVDSVTPSVIWSCAHSATSHRPTSHWLAVYI